MTPSSSSKSSWAISLELKRGCRWGGSGPRLNGDEFMQRAIQRHWDAS